MWYLALACLGVPALVGVALLLTRRTWLARLLDLPPARYAISATRNIAVPMADGSLLRADRYSPRGEGSFPTILIRSPWGRGWERPPLSLTYLFIAGRFAERGFHVLVQSVRERAPELAQYPANEASDGQATLEWLRGQPWFNGKLGWWGASYLGHIQWAGAVDAPSHLRAIMPITTAARWPAFFYDGGLLALERLLTISYVARLPHLPAALVPGALRRQATAVARAAAHLPLGTADVALLGAPDPAYRDLLAHPPDAARWAAVDHSAGLARVSAAVHLVAGWHDIFLREQLADYARLRAAGRRPRLTIGPWHHTDQELSGAAIRLGLAWFADQLGPRPAPAPAQPVRVLVMGTSQWRDLADWPPPAGERRYYLRASRELSSVAPVEPAASERYRYDPADPTPALGGQLLGPTAGARDNAALLARPDLLAYTTAPLDADLEIMGDVRAELFLSSSASHTDLVARLCVVDEAGRATNICDGVVRIANAAGGTFPDGSLLARIPLGPTAYRFRRGQRLQLLVASAAHPRWARNLGTGEPATTATALAPTEQTLHHDQSHPSALVLPVV